MPADILGKHVCYIGIRDQNPLEKVLLKKGGKVPDKTQGPASDKDAAEGRAL